MVKMVHDNADVFENAKRFLAAIIIENRNIILRRTIMKITELDLKTEGKRYKCDNNIFIVKDGDLLEVEINTYLKDLCIPISELLEMEFEEIDNKLFSTANYFNNKEYAKYIAFKETLMRRLDKFAWDHNAKAVTWGDGSTKYYILFSHTDNRVIVDWDFMYMSNNIYFTSREIAEKAIEEFKDDLIKLYTWEFDF